MKRKNSYWIVQTRDELCDDWKYKLGSLAETRELSVRLYSGIGRKAMGLPEHMIKRIREEWKLMRQAGVVRCVKLKLLPDETEE